ncbi:MAG: hypothetical protein FWE25_05225 [Lachnospiraceae bacterium]|nr:hypothetical protein [Lachnospiraceae bacterium]
MKEKMHKFESDLIPKEKRQMEIEKIKAMTFPEKASHMWAYHKFIVFLPVLLVLLFVFVFQWIDNSRHQDVLRIAITDSRGMDGENAAKEIKYLLNIDNRFSVISLDHSYFSQGGELDMQSVQKFVVIVAAQGMDLFIVNEHVFAHYMQQDVFMDLALLFSEEELAKMNLVLEYGIDISDSPVATEMFGVYDSPAVLGIIANIDLESLDQDGTRKRDMIRNFYHRVIRGSIG